MKAASLSAALLLATLTATAQPAPPGEFAELEALARSELAAIHAPGAAIAIVKGKIDDLRFSLTPTGGGAARTFALVTGPDGTIAFLYMGSRAFEKAATKPS